MEEGLHFIRVVRSSPRQAHDIMMFGPDPHCTSSLSILFKILINHVQNRKWSKVNQVSYDISQIKPKSSPKEGREYPGSFIREII